MSASGGLWSLHCLRSVSNLHSPAMLPWCRAPTEVLQNTDLGSQAQIRMRLHPVNHGPSDLSIQRMTLWDFSHPDKGGSHACAITLRAHASAETTQEFTVERPEYQLWQKGLRPRLVLRMGGPASTRGRTMSESDNRKPHPGNHHHCKLDRAITATRAGRRSPVLVGSGSRLGAVRLRFRASTPSPWRGAFDFKALVVSLRRYLFQQPARPRLFQEPFNQTRSAQTAASP